MAKRKAGVNDIIYELDNDDIEISSDDEAKEPKKGRFGSENVKKSCENKSLSGRMSAEVISLDSSDETFVENQSSNKTHNGGKTSSEITTTKHKLLDKANSNDIQEKQSQLVHCKKIESNCVSTIIFDEDIIIDSPVSNNDLDVVGCENRTPLITVRFKDSKLAHVYKKTIKDFLLNLLKSRSEEINDSMESDNELDIWPEDLINEDCNRENIDTAIDDGLFFVDTAPCNKEHIEIPEYRQSSSVISNIPEKVESPIAARRKQSCFNCDGDHNLRDCPLPRDNYRIAEKRKTMPTKVGRYHVEDDQKYGHLVPGRISAALRSAMGLKRYELPLYIYRMRLLGYPPGWLEEARISHSGLTMFDSTGTAIQDPDEEEGEVCEPGSKDKFDIKKILDYPGFNVPASKRYIEEAHLFGLPPMSEQDSKMIMLQALAPNAVKAYKRKKLLLFPTSNNNFLQGQAEMELDSGDEVAEFPSVPPLPDEAPPPAPPPPPPLPSIPPDDENVKSNSPDKQKSPNNKTNNDKVNNKNQVDLEVSSDVEVIGTPPLNDIPVPEDNWITIDEDFDSNSQASSGRNSPTLDDLEKKKRLLLTALKSDVVPKSEAVIELSESIGTPKDCQSDSIEFTEIEELLESAEKQQSDRENKVEEDNKKNESKENNVHVKLTQKTDQFEEVKEDNKDNKTANEDNSSDDISAINEQQSSGKKVEVSKPANKTDEIDIENNCNRETNDSESTSTSSASQEIGGKTPDTKAGNVKNTHYGAPVINIASSYVKLPSEDKFAKDICDVINFENLPNSTGKFKQINSLLKKVKTLVDRIQES